MAYLEVHRPTQALDESRVAISIDSSYALAYNLMGLVYLELKDNGKAEDSFRTALNLAPADPEISNNYGWFLCQTGRGKQAQNYFKTAYLNTMFNGIAVAMTNAAICADLSKDVQLADQLFSEALLREPTNGRSGFLYAEFLYRQGRFSDARTRLNELHRRGDTTVKSVWLALKTARKLGDRQEEARYSSLLRQRYADSPEHEMLTQGKFE